MNLGVVLVLCTMCLLIGFELGSWKEGKAVSKAVDDLSAMHYKEIQIFFDKLVKARLNLIKDRKDGEDDE